MINSPESLGPNTPEHLFGESQAVTRLRNQLLTQATPESTLSSDLRIVAFSLGAEAAIREDANARQVTEAFLAKREGISTAYAARLLFIGMQADLMRHQERNDYPRADKYLYPETWHELLCRLANPQAGESHDKFVDFIENHEAQSNVSHRYASLSFLLSIMPEQLGERPKQGKYPNIADIGGSTGKGNKQVALAGHYPFRKVIGVRKIAAADNMVEYEEDAVLTVKFNTGVASGLELGASISVDIAEMDDPETLLRIKSGSLNPKQQMKPSEIERYDTLDMAVPLDISKKEIIRRYTGDFASLDLEDFAAHSPVDHYNVVMISTILYQLTEAEKNSVLNNAKKIVKPDGLIVVQDFAKIDKTDKTRLRFYNNWYRPYQYRTLVLDQKSDTPDEFLEILVWDSGRCEKVMLGRDFHRLPTSGPLKDMLKDDAAEQ